MSFWMPTDTGVKVTAIDLFPPAATVTDVSLTPNNPEVDEISLISKPLLPLLKIVKSKVLDCPMTTSPNGRLLTETAISGIGTDVPVPETNITIDPSSGSLLEIVMVADLDPSELGWKLTVTSWLPPAPTEKAVVEKVNWLSLEDIPDTDRTAVPVLEMASDCAEDWPI